MAKLTKQKAAATRAIRKHIAGSDAEQRAMAIFAGYRQDFAKHIEDFPHTEVMLKRLARAGVELDVLAELADDMRSRGENPDFIVGDDGIPVVHPLRLLEAQLCAQYNRFIKSLGLSQERRKVVLRAERKADGGGKAAAAAAADPFDNPDL